jgi:hypothetical protein
VAEDPLSFSLDWLAESSQRKRPLAVCAAGHLVVRERTCWQPLYFSADLRSLWCKPVDHPDKTTES